MLYIVGLLALSLLITASIVIVFLFLASRFAYWLAISPNTKVAKIRALLKPLLEGTNQDTTTNTSNEGSQQGRQKHKCLIHRLHPVQSIQELYPLLKTRERRVDNFTRTGEDCRTYQKKNYRTERPKTSVKSFVPRRPFPGWRTLSRWHIRSILGRLKRSVNQSGKEPSLMNWRHRGNRVL